MRLSPFGFVLLCFALLGSPAFANCIYASQSYAQGSVIKQADGKLYTCDGSAWTQGSGDPTKIKIIIATYGHGQQRITVSHVLAKLCDGRQSCTFSAGDKLFGGSHIGGYPRDLWVRYSCGGHTAEQHEQAGGKYTISC